MVSSLVFKVYSNGFRKKLSSQNPFLANNKQVVNTLHKGGAPLLLTRNLNLVNNLVNKGLNFTRQQSCLNYSTESEGSFVSKLSG